MELYDFSFTLTRNALTFVLISDGRNFGLVIMINSSPLKQDVTWYIFGVSNAAENQV